jgi:hypothetical protein
MAGQATDDNMAHAHYMLATKCYKHALRIRSTYCLSTTNCLHEHSSMLRYRYIACLVNYYVSFMPVSCMLFYSCPLLFVCLYCAVSLMRHLAVDS